MKERQYEVEIYEKHSHGCLGKMHYFGWILSSDKKANAESFAIEILAGMTPNEICEESDGKLRTGLCRWSYIEPIGDGKCRIVELDSDKPIGYAYAEQHFTAKARVFKG